MSSYNDSYIGESEVFLDFQQRIADAAAVDRSVLVIGERGSGKEMAASRLHYLSKRWQKNLVTVNCAALAPTLIESELFGYEQGAFTGANKTRKGRFEEAQGGTLFLDEIGNIPMQVQEKILRVVEYGTYERVGSSITHEADVRIIGATNADLKQMCKEGKFKEDLLDRLSFEVIFIPPLRERGDDILLLANYFAQRMAMECGQDIPVFTEDVQQMLKTYSWPGNVRELKNTIERAVYRSKGDIISSIVLDPFRNPYSYETNDVPGGISNAGKVLEVEKTDMSESDQAGKKEFSFDSLPLDSLDQTKDALEASFVQRALKQAQGNQREAAKLMKITYDQFRGLYRKHKVNPS
ncbi:MAG: phage shock protein operon transcriptional activator [Spirochaetales bacterium]|nr:phage shock protein operon transcriptional activator [Spirochaetales bacterium]